jgi:hypothetical protein
MAVPVTAKQTFEMLENQSLWDVAGRVREFLGARGIDFAVAGGVAVCLHGYRRNTVDLDLLVRAGDVGALQAALEAEGFSWCPGDREFRAPSGIPVQLLVAGERAGPGQPVVFPDPRDPNCRTEIEGLPVLTLAKLIELKLACGLGNLRRTHKDFADVVELIAANRLDGSFARHLHKSVRGEFRELVRRVSGS